VKLTENFNISANVVVRAYEDGVLAHTRESHNVFVNTGRAWLAKMLGASDYSVDPPTPHATEKVAYIGLGCGGALQTDANFANTQPETVTVTALEDPIPVSQTGGGVKTWLKKVLDQSYPSNVFFPGDFRTAFIADFVESEVSYALSTSYTSGILVGTNAPVSEAGLYLSTANPALVTPTDVNRLVAYNTFSAIPVTPNTVLRVNWELRL
jgi:hypothetical protein